MLSLDDFKSLSYDKQCDYIITCADYLVYRVEADRKYYLYHVDAYFIEVTYIPYENKVLAIDAFSDTDELEPYLDFVDLAALSV